jgi:hypothetical protein
VRLKRVKFNSDHNLGDSGVFEDQDSFTLDVSTDDEKPQFRLFLKLPSELRRRIWGFAAPPPAVIDGIYYMQAGKTPILSTHPLTAFHALLHVFSESRKAMLYKDGVKTSHSIYQIIFKSWKICGSVVTSRGEIAHLSDHYTPTSVSFGYDVPYINQFFLSREYS